MGDSLDSYPGINIVSWFGEQARLAHISLNRKSEKNLTVMDACPPLVLIFRFKSQLLLTYLTLMGTRNFFIST